MRRLLRPAALVCVSAVVGLLGASAAHGDVTDNGTDPASEVDADLLFRWQDERIAESSGLAVSRRHDGITWTINDSGDDAIVYAVDRRGRTVADFRIGDLVPRDWEALGAGLDAEGRPALFIGDIGDNSQTRDNGILVHVVTEPSRLDGGTLEPTSYRLRYPDAPADAETLLVDPRTNRLRIVTKEFLGGGIYEAPAELDPDAPNVLTRVADAPSLLTDGTALPDGRFVLRDYYRGLLYAEDGELITSIRFPPQEQGEAVAATPDGRSVLISSEGAGSEVWRVPVPAPDGPDPGTGDPGSPAAGGDDAGTPSGTSAGDEDVIFGAGAREIYAWAGAGLLAVLLIAVGWLTSRSVRHRRLH